MSKLKKNMEVIALGNMKAVFFAEYKEMGVGSSLLHSTVYTWVLLVHLSDKIKQL